MTREYPDCCPKFEPERYDDIAFRWDCKKFIKASIPTFFHIPLPSTIGKKVSKMKQMAVRSDALADDRLNDLLLFNDPSAFKSDMYLSVSEYIPNANNTIITGTFVSKVFDGPYSDLPKFIRHMESHVREQGKKPHKYYVHYAYCPKCSKRYGHNYMVVFAATDN